MNVLELAERTCTKCSETKLLNAFYLAKTGKRAGTRSSWCRECAQAYQRTHKAERVAELGDEVVRAEQREHTRRHRELTGDVRNRLVNAARRRAMSKLMDAHRKEYDLLLKREKYDAGLL